MPFARAFGFDFGLRPISGHLSSGSFNRHTIANGVAIRQQREAEQKHITIVMPISLVVLQTQNLPPERV